MPAESITQFEALCSPAAERNKTAILRALQTRLPGKGTLLELASGALQHALHIAPHFPKLRWQTSEVDERVLALASAYAQALGERWPNNAQLPIRLNVNARPWQVGRFDALYLANLLHISAFATTVALFAEAPRVLTDTGQIFIYGPFKQDGVFRSAADSEFDRSLKHRNANWGIRDLDTVQQLAQDNGLCPTEVQHMPANNLLLCFKKS